MSESEMGTLTSVGRRELLSRVECLELLEKSSLRLMAAAQQAVQVWGVHAQLRQLTEECGELVAAVNQHERGRVTQEELAEECADVLIMLAQARVILGPHYDAAVEGKLTRLEQRLAQWRTP